MTTYTAKNAKRQPGKRRARPQPYSLWVMHLAGWLGVLSIWLPGFLAWPARILSVTFFLAFIVQKFRAASWDVDHGIRQELDQ